ncbi:MAG: carboxypeptidase-like regulatory domain-containing protein [Nitrospira sp.]|nr:carboxypeptidase-like regulatory domain-containing protein [Nitrospira sp.]
MRQMSPLWGTGGILMAIAILFSGCVSVSYDDIASPTLRGIVHRDGKPVENALVSIEAPRGDTCVFTGGVSMRTDRDGRFQFKAQKGFHAFSFARSTSHFQVCIVDGRFQHQGWYERKMRGDGEQLTLDCNMESPVPAFRSTMTGKAMGICRITQHW